MDVKKATLDQLVSAARERRMSPEEMEAQRVNFAFGNAPDGDKGTVDTVRAAAKFIKQNCPA